MAGIQVFRSTFLKFQLTNFIHFRQFSISLQSKWRQRQPKVLQGARLSPRKKNKKIKCGPWAGRPHKWPTWPAGDDLSVYRQRGLRQPVIISNIFVQQQTTLHTKASKQLFPLFKQHLLQLLHMIHLPRLLHLLHLLQFLLLQHLLHLLNLLHLLHLLLLLNLLLLLHLLLLIYLLHLLLLIYLLHLLYLLLLLHLPNLIHLLLMLYLLHLLLKLHLLHLLLFYISYICYILCNFYLCYFGYYNCY